MALEETDFVVLTPEEDEALDPAREAVKRIVFIDGYLLRLDATSRNLYGAKELEQRCAHTQTAAQSVLATMQMGLTRDSALESVKAVLLKMAESVDGNPNWARDGSFKVDTAGIMTAVSEAMGQPQAVRADDALGVGKKVIDFPNAQPQDLGARGRDGSMLAAE